MKDEHRTDELLELLCLTTALARRPVRSVKMLDGHGSIPVEDSRSRGRSEGALVGRGGKSENDNALRVAVPLVERICVFRNGFRRMALATVDSSLTSDAVVGTQMAKRALGGFRPGDG